MEKSGKSRLEDMVRRKVPKKAEPSVSPKATAPLKLESEKRSRYMLWSVAAISLSVLLLALSFLIARAEVDIYPKVEQVTLDESLSATKTSPSGLSYNLVIISGEKSAKLETTEEREVAERATGTVIIFNSYSAAPQRLDVDTRLLGSNGKLYKTRTKTTVPGMKPDGSSGSVEVGIYAAEAGASYNSGPLDFDIVGFKGTPKYEKFKVRTKPGTEISGGFRGTTLVATVAEKQEKVGELTEALREELVKKAIDQIPPGFILWEEGAAFRADKIEFPPGQEELMVTMRGTLYGLLFEEKELVQTIAKRKVEGYKESDIYIPGIRDLDFTLLGPAPESLETAQSISFKLSGPAEIVWRVETDELVSELLGQAKRNFTAIVSAHENIERAELTLFPPWKRSIPEEARKLKIIVH